LIERRYNEFPARCFTRAFTGSIFNPSVDQRKVRLGGGGGGGGGGGANSFTITIQASGAGVSTPQNIGTITVTVN
ncbi:MAG: hypothetical protein WAO35_28445, partial [Terriglobia bacterium]